MIDTYLRQLDGELHVPRRLRRRILDETRDHLLEAVDAGLGEEEAVQAFGAPGALARQFHEQLAGSSAHHASTLSGVMLIAIAALFAAAPVSGTYGPVSVFAGQVAVVAGVLALVRSLRYRAEGAVPASALPDIYRANAVTLACVVAIVVDLAANGGSAALAAGSAALAVAGAATLLQSRVRARPLPASEPESDAVDDLLALAPRNVASGAADPPWAARSTTIATTHASVTALAR